jgi:pyruvate formate-lyase/glycerol dehydratase family glycyl radical enzyme
MQGGPSDRIISLKKKTLGAKRFLSIIQAGIITEVYRKNKEQPLIVKRAKALAASLLQMPISIDPEELIVGNRTPGIRAGVVFPEAGISWLVKEIETLPVRPQDPFQVKMEDIAFFKDTIEPYWRGKTLEDAIYGSAGELISSIEKVVKINQKDHAQGHICPKVEDWLKYGPAGLSEKVKNLNKRTGPDKKRFYESVIIVLDASCRFISRYSLHAEDLAKKQPESPLKKNLEDIAMVCRNLSVRPPSTFREALQSVWFLFVILHMESNASSFSPGRMDQYLYPYFRADLKDGELNMDFAQELLDALFIKFNQVVYMRNSHSAKYFAGFPIGFNITVGGRGKEGGDATNELSYLFLTAQDHVRLPQPNLTARIHRYTPQEFLEKCTHVIGTGTGMPQIANDESIIPALENAGISLQDSLDYVLVGCVELSPQGNFLGWSDAAMFNLVKVLELTCNDGKCMITGEQLGIRTGKLNDYDTYKDFEAAYRHQIDYFFEKMIRACESVEKYHQVHLPSPFLSSVVDNCLVNGKDVTAGGAKYNYSGIQAIQVANVADSLAVLKKLVFEENLIDKKTLLDAMLNNFKDDEPLRQICINKVPKYGNDIAWIDELGSVWTEYFYNLLSKYDNLRGGKYQMGLYTVSAHVPMGENVAATPDGRSAQAPLADGGLSPMYGRDKHGPTAILNSVKRIPSILAGNGTLLNMKFLPSFFDSSHSRQIFTSLLRSFAMLPVHHVQFNVVTNEELKKAKADPESYRDLTIRVAGYTAYFTELAGDLQDEIIERTAHG